MGRFSGKVAVITGASSGIGRATALKLASEGASLMLTDLRIDDAQAIAKEITAAGGNAMASAADLGEESEIARLVAHTNERLGGIDLLNNTAGYTASEQTGNDRDIHELDAEVWDKAFRINLRGHMLMCKHVIPTMMKRGGGSIVNISSTAGIHALGAIPSYSASKMGIHSLTQNIATRYGRDRIRCNTIAPGLISTPLTRTINKDIFEVLWKHNALPYAGEPDDIAAGALFLLSDEAKYVTGHLMVIDGGLTCRAPTVRDMYNLAARLTAD